MAKFNVNNRVQAEGKGAGTILEVAAPGKHLSGTSSGLETRYRVKWDHGPRTWFRESALKPIIESNLPL